VPDISHAENPLEDEPLMQAGEIVLERWSPDFLLVTLGAQGMLLWAKGGSPQHVPTKAREVFEVSGAGDTVMATCLMALASGATYEEAADLANYAAGVVVGKLGTATCSPKELISYMQA
jgi:D-beta-D-heptose 7-phosphate kinase/D-beta-D-heptose 1-phosphate adenosyltransferase